MLSRLALLAVVVIATAGPVDVAPVSRDPEGVVAHEWGTFTSIAGENGDAVEWWTLGGPQDLPCFVDRFKNVPKTSIAGTVRMETPVLYFYSPRETRVDVTVRFHKGIITEWFPRAVVAPIVTNRAHTLTWSNVRVLPRSRAEFPRESEPSHYYAARETDAAAVQVGNQHEKFLFYRGVGGFSIPVNVRTGPDGQVVVKNKGADSLPAFILFENRGGRLRYRQHSATPGGAEATIDLPSRAADFASLAATLESLLTAGGLYPREAQAMIATWRDSWFEEGTRLFYIVPQSTIDAVLPLSVNPRPAGITRVFVGRVELLTPATLADVSDAIARNDPKAAVKYGRFLPTIVERLLPSPRTPSQRAEADRVLSPLYASSGSAMRCTATPASR